VPSQPVVVNLSIHVHLLLRYFFDHADLAEEHQAQEEDGMDGGWGWMVVLGEHSFHIQIFNLK
jgi:hypothetical protein